MPLDSKSTHQNAPPQGVSPPHGELVKLSSLTLQTPPFHLSRGLMDNSDRITLQILLAKEP